MGARGCGCRVLADVSDSRESECQESSSPELNTSGAERGCAPPIALGEASRYSYQLLCVSTPVWNRVEAAQLHGLQASADSRGNHGPGNSPALTWGSGQRTIKE